MIINVDIYAVLLLAKKSQFTRFLVCKIFGPKIRSCKMFDKFQVCSDDHFQEACPFGWSFARGLTLRMIICNCCCCWMIVIWMNQANQMNIVNRLRTVPLDDHLQEAGPLGCSFARGLSLWMMICKRPAPTDDHLQKAGPYGCKKPVPLDD